jgi:hypothetical protein
MDLQTITNKVKSDAYYSVEQFHADINLIFLNSYKYNQKLTHLFQVTI